jgi:hypothetical protein
MAIDPLKISIKGSTQEHLPVEDIIDDVVLLKDGSCASVMQVSSVNFDLLSEGEQSALISAYGGILNSLNFPIQIIIKSTTKDVGSYLKRLIDVEKKQTNALLRERIKHYKNFIEETVKKNDVLSKTFYVVVKFSIVELGLKGIQKGGLKSLFNLNLKKESKLPFSKKYILEKAKASLEPKRDHLMRLFSRLGLDITALKNQELIELFYKIYNEEVENNQKLQDVDFNKAVVNSKNK